MATSRSARWIGGIALAIGVLVLVIAFFPWNILRGPVASYASRHLDRPVTIAGDLNVHIGLTPRIEVNDVTVGNAPWSDLQPMAHVKHAAFTLNLLSLLSRSPSIPAIELTEPTLVLERNAQGAANWHFGSDEDQQSRASVRVGGIRIEGGRLRFRDPGLQADIAAQIDSVSRPDDPDGGLRFTGKGQYRGEPFALDGTGLGLSALRRVDEPYKVQLHATAGATEVSFNGSVVPASVQHLQGDIRLKGPDLSQLHPIVPITLPWTPPYQLSGTLAHENATWRMTNVAGVMGKSDLTGMITLDLSQPRRAIVADLASRQMHYEDLGGLVGLPPGNVGKEVRSREQRAEATKREVSARVLPTKRYNVEGLRGFDADIKFRGNNVRWSRFPVDNITVHAVLKQGVMTLQPLDFGIADGHVVSRFRFDLNGSPPRADGQLELRNIELKKLFPQLASPRGSAGRIGGTAKFRTQGDNVAALLAAADADGGLIMSGGEASTLALVLTNLDLARAASLLLRGDETSEVRCAASSFTIRDGLFEPQFMVMDTSTEKITTTGTINFDDERYDLHLKAHSKQPSLVALRGPIAIVGTFRNPTVRPEPVPLLARLGAAVGLGLISPPLALLALVDAGNAKDADCAALINDAKPDPKRPLPNSDQEARGKAKSTESVADARRQRTKE